MRGLEIQQQELFSYKTLEERVPLTIRCGWSWSW